MQVKSDAGGEDIGLHIWSLVLSSACYLPAVLARSAGNFPGLSFLIYKMNQTISKGPFIANTL